MTYKIRYHGRVALVASLLAAAFCAPLAQAATLRFADAAPRTDLQQRLADAFKSQIEKQSQDLKIKIYPNGQLGNDSQMIDGVRSGIIDLEMSGVNNFTGLVPEASVFNLPFLFANRKQAYAVLDGPVGTRIRRQFSSVGLKALGYPENGFREMTNNRGPVQNPSDLKGLRMRVNSSRVLNNMFGLLGANPQQIPVNELYTALENGVVDAQDQPLTIVQSFKFYEVQKYLSLTHHAYSPLLLVMNKKKFDDLSAADQQIIQNAANSAIKLERKLSIQRSDKLLDALENEGMKINRNVDTAAFRKAVQPVWQTYEKQHGKKLINEIQQQIQSLSS